MKIEIKHKFKDGKMVVPEITLRHNQQATELVGAVALSLSALMPWLAVFNLKR